MRMTTRNKTHFQNVPTGQKSTGRLLPRHFSTVKLKKNFENKVWKTTDLLNRKMEKNGQRASYLIYLHKHCTELCKKRGLYTTLSYTIGYALIWWICRYTGCGTLFSTDGNWKLNYPICMYQAPKDVSGFDGKLNYISSCSNGPLPGKAFCLHHCAVVEKEGIPTGLREFLQFCGISHKGVYMVSI